MYAYHLVYDIPSENHSLFRVLVAYKNVYGSRFNDNPARPTVLNGAGQLVIPGGSVAADNVITGGRTEFFEETGINLNDAFMRDHMGCVGAAWHGVLDYSRRAYCVYQEVENVEFVENACNDRIRNGLPPDDELHATEVYDGSVVSGRFGPISLNELTSDWRGAQYGQLDAERQNLARQRSRDPGDWYRDAVARLQEALRA